jgi:hypothetical protein
MNRLIKYSVIFILICSAFTGLRAYGDEYNNAFLFPNNYRTEKSPKVEKPSADANVTEETTLSEDYEILKNYTFAGEFSLESLSPGGNSRIGNMIISPNNVNESYSIPISELIGNLTGNTHYKFEDRTRDNRGHAIRYVPLNEIRSYEYDINRGTLYPNIYGDASIVPLFHLDTIDLTKKIAPSDYYVSREKNIKTDFNDFAKASIIPYGWNWAERLLIAPQNVTNVYSNNPSGFLDNIKSWQGCKKDFCGDNSIRASFWSLPFSDGDNLNTNYFQHPLSGMTTYLYYRAVGFDKVTSSIGSVMQSLLFEYTIESWQQPPSLNDIVMTPLIGIPIAMVLEYCSGYLLQTDSQFLRALGYILNPATILIPGGDIQWHRLLGFTFKFNSF